MHMFSVELVAAQRKIGIRTAGALLLFSLEKFFVKNLFIQFYFGLACKNECIVFRSLLYLACTPCNGHLASFYWK